MAAGGLAGRETLPIMTVTYDRAEMIRFWAGDGTDAVGDETVYLWVETDGGRDAAAMVEDVVARLNLARLERALALRSSFL